MFQQASFIESLILFCVMCLLNSLTKNMLACCVCYIAPVCWTRTLYSPWQAMTTIQCALPLYTLDLGNTKVIIWLLN